jgi:hypothetical protein
MVPIGAFAIPGGARLRPTLPQATMGARRPGQISGFGPGSNDPRTSVRPRTRPDRHDRPPTAHLGAGVPKNTRAPGCLPRRSLILQARSRSSGHPPPPRELADSPHESRHLRNHLWTNQTYTGPCRMLPVTPDQLALRSASRRGALQVDAQIILTKPRLLLPWPPNASTCTSQARSNLRLP